MSSIDRLVEEGTGQAVAPAHLTRGRGPEPIPDRAELLTAPDDPRVIDAGRMAIAHRPAGQYRGNPGAIPESTKI
jgi:hypothetical protein